jgi:hypothetical protein
VKRQDTKEPALYPHDQWPANPNHVIITDRKSHYSQNPTVRMNMRCPDIYYQENEQTSEKANRKPFRAKGYHVIPDHEIPLPIDPYPWLARLKTTATVRTYRIKPRDSCATIRASKDAIFEIKIAAGACGLIFRNDCWAGRTDENVPLIRLACRWRYRHFCQMVTRSVLRL